MIAVLQQASLPTSLPPGVARISGAQWMHISARFSKHAHSSAAPAATSNMTGYVANADAGAVPVISSSANPVTNTVQIWTDLCKWHLMLKKQAVACIQQHHSTLTRLTEGQHENPILLLALIALTGVQGCAHCRAEHLQCLLCGTPAGGFHRPMG